jgi:hypothetical protein
VHTVGFYYKNIQNISFVLIDDLLFSPLWSLKHNGVCSIKLKLFIHAPRKYTERVRCRPYAFFNFSLDRGVWSPSGPDSFTSEKETPVPSNREMIEPKSRYGRFGEQQYLIQWDSYWILVQLVLRVLSVTGSLSFNNVHRRSLMIWFPNSPRFLLSIHYTRYTTYLDTVTQCILGTARAIKTQSTAHLRRTALRSSGTKFTILINNESLHIPFLYDARHSAKKVCDN